MPRKPAKPSKRGSADPDKIRAQKAYQAGDFRTAIAHASLALARRPRDADLLHLQGSAMVQLGDPQGGLEKLMMADKASPMNTPILLSLAQTQRKLQLIDEMNTTIERALYAAPKNAQAINLKAQSLREQGRYDDAERVLAPALEREPDNPVLLTALASLCVSTKDTQRGVEACERTLALPALAPDVERFTLFTLAQLLDMQGRYDEAFETYARGNAMMGPGKVNEAEPVIRLWSRERLDSIPPSPEASELPLLIVGMPRSGTTLIEQMLAAHPRVQTVGESHTLPTLARALTPSRIDPPGIHELGRRYLASLARVRDERTERVVDKMPGNYMHLGALSRACPGARVIHTRRDPRDTCLSCYFQNFGRTHTYARDLTLCARQYAEHLKLMAHWREVTPLPILDLEYAALVNDPETELRRVLDFAGLEFDPACLSYHESDRTVTTASRDQVRQPVYRSSLARWKRYEKHIGAMVKVLEEGGAL